MNANTQSYPDLPDRPLLEEYLKLNLQWILQSKTKITLKQKCLCCLAAL